jgi:5-formyltetrahydrofolate cyclo-ligase
MGDALMPAETTPRVEYEIIYTQKVRKREATHAHRALYEQERQSLAANLVSLGNLMLLPEVERVALYMTVDGERVPRAIIHASRATGRRRALREWIIMG